MAPPKQVEEPEWPPRSPREVLLTTPGGRERLRQLANRTSPSPSPLKKSRTPALEAAMDDEDEDEDEETLQLKLQMIQARLKLKKLQSAKTKKDDEPKATTGKTSRPESAPLSPRKRSAFTSTTRTQSQTEVVIPASPVRTVRAGPPPQTSPKRVLLGIDKGLAAKDVSLKRAPSFRKNPDSQTGYGTAQRNGGYLQTSRTTTTESPGASAIARPLTFNERLAAARSQESDLKVKHERVQQARTQSFDITRTQMDIYKSKAVDIKEQAEAPAEHFSRDEVLAGQRSNGVPSQGTQPSSTDDSTAGKGSRAKRAPEDIPEAEASAFEPYSSLHLTRRNIPHSVLTRHFTGKKILTIKDMLGVVKAPNFELPDYEQDIVFFAIVAKRSEPRVHKGQAQSNKTGREDDRGKYMVVTLVDLQYELELFLFDTGFQRYWKIPEGTVLAILNPTLMPPPRGREDTGRFSIVINSDEDKVIEVGMARDLGFCISIKKDGTACNSWVNQKRTKFCEYHTNEAINKARKSRIELNAWDGLGPGKNSKKKSWWDKTSAFDKKDDSKYANKYSANPNYNYETHSHWFASKSLSSADLIDGSSALADKREKQEGLKRRLLAQERERGIMERLGKLGSGTGAEYMKQAHKGSQVPAAAGDVHASSPAPDGTPKLDAAALDLLAPRSKDHKVLLGPVKRKRAESALSATTATTAAKSTTAFGWGGSLKDKLTRMKGGEKFQPETENVPPPAPGPSASASSSLSSGDRQPVRKKTRFVTEKGIREAGRESLGDALPVLSGGRRMVTLDDDDDDDLVILR